MGAATRVTCVEHSDSESNFGLQEVHPGLDDLSDEPTEASSEEQDGGSGIDGDDVESGAWGHGEVVSLRSLPNYKFDPDEHFENVCVTGADGANAASSSAAVAHPSAGVSHGRKQTKLPCLFNCLLQ